MPRTASVISDWEASDSEPEMAPLPASPLVDIAKDLLHKTRRAEAARLREERQNAKALKTVYKCVHAMEALVANPRPRPRVNSEADSELTAAELVPTLVDLVEKLSLITEGKLCPVPKCSKMFNVGNQTIGHIRGTRDDAHVAFRRGHEEN
ncbi:hypothetical protein HDU85_001650 [Gaertneriomyces sp. JEL0708]|nr:hypothetical protein HDU85_001650 [Gaertneriomyces sp. JEL0708]